MIKNTKHHLAIGMDEHLDWDAHTHLSSFETYFMEALQHLQVAEGEQW